MRAVEEEYLAAWHFELKSAVVPYKMSLIYMSYLEESFQMMWRCQNQRHFP